MKTILIVESESTVRALYSLELGDEGYNILLAQNDQEALDMLKARPVDLVITGMVQCDEGSISRKNAFFQKISCPVIMNTGYPSDVMQLIPFERISHILKSSNLEMLKELISRLLGGAEGFSRAGQKSQTDFPYHYSGTPIDAHGQFVV